jgi:hypothetical protein
MEKQLAEVVSFRPALRFGGALASSRPSHSRGNAAQ